MTNPHIAPPAHSSTQEIGGHHVVLAYADVSAEYAAMRHEAIVVDRSHRGRMRVSGAKAADVLTGLVTNDVAALHPGQGQYAAALTAKGKVIADVRIFADAGSYLIDVPPRAWPGWLETVKKFVNPRLARYRDDSETLRNIGIFGATARHVVSALTGVNASALTALPFFGQVHAEVRGLGSGSEAAVLVACVPDLGIEGFDLFVPAESFDRVWTAAIAAGATPAGLGACEIARIEAGRPEWGIDIDDSTLAQEANFDELGAVSYTKGCYIGQEVVARVHFRGHVNKHLRGLRAASVEPPPTGARLMDAAGNDVGDVRSAGASPRLGGIALAMVRRDVTPGTSLLARWDGGERAADLTPLPFPS
jgi:folate-binding protein YgfZ